MQARFRSILVPLVAVAFLGGDCGDDPMMVNPAPDLSGTYDLVSFTQAGVTLTPPAARWDGTKNSRRDRAWMKAATMMSA